MLYCHDNTVVTKPFHLSVGRLQLVRFSTTWRFFPARILGHNLGGFCPTVRHTYDPVGSPQKAANLTVFAREFMGPTSADGGCGERGGGSGGGRGSYYFSSAYGSKDAGAAGAAATSVSGATGGTSSVERSSYGFSDGLCSIGGGCGGGGGGGGGGGEGGGGKKPRVDSPGKPPHSPPHSPPSVALNLMGPAGGAGICGERESSRIEFRDSAISGGLHGESCGVFAAGPPPGAPAEATRDFASALWGPTSPASARYPGRDAESESTGISAEGNAGKRGATAGAAARNGGGSGGGLMVTTASAAAAAASAAAAGARVGGNGAAGKIHHHDLVPLTGLTTTSMRKVHKADREKLRRDRLNDQFAELATVLSASLPSPMRLSTFPSPLPCRAFPLPLPPPMHLSPSAPLPCALPLPLPPFYAP
ncbi:unnamed protein product [Closterium sp. NIES-53]